MHAEAVSVGILPVAVGGESTGIGTSPVVGVPAEDERRGNTVCFTLNTLTYRLTVCPHREMVMYNILLCAPQADNVKGASVNASHHHG